MGRDWSDSKADAATVIHTEIGARDRTRHIDIQSSDFIMEHVSFHNELLAGEELPVFSRRRRSLGRAVLLRHTFLLMPASLPVLRLALHAAVKGDLAARAGLERGRGSRSFADAAVGTVAARGMRGAGSAIPGTPLLGTMQQHDP